MFCTNCGSPLRDGQKFCENCGSPVTQSAAAVQAAPARQETQWNDFSAVSAAAVKEQWNDPDVSAYTDSKPRQEDSGSTAYGGSAPQGEKYGSDADFAPESDADFQFDDRGHARAITGCGIKLALRRFFFHYSEFTGRASRSEYWWSVLMTWAIGILANWLGHVSSTIPTVVTLSLICPSIAMFVRREHDIGHRWTRMLVGLIPFFGWIMLLVDMLKPSDGANRFGPAPISYDDLPEQF